jgi:hypothetical protein
MLPIASTPVQRTDAMLQAGSADVLCHHHERQETPNVSRGLCPRKGTAWRRGRAGRPLEVLLEAKAKSSSVFRRYRRDGRDSVSTPVVTSFVDARNIGGILRVAGADAV